MAKCVSFRPNASALLFIRSTNALSEPAIFSAIATEASLPEAIAMPLSISSTVISSPGSRKICEPPMDAAYSLVRTLSVNCSFPSSSASTVSSIVIIFVMLAGGSLSWLFFS
ncbi:hypothetical protein D3C71_1908840 [compost metagenome]